VSIAHCDDPGGGVFIFAGIDTESVVVYCNSKRSAMLKTPKMLLDVCGSALFKSFKVGRVLGV